MPDRQLRLVVSASSAILDQFRWYGFRRLDLVVRTGASAKELIDLARQQAPDAIVAEALLSAGTGFDVARVLKSVPELSHVPIVVVSEGQVTPAVASAIVESGCDTLLTSPIARGQLYEALSTLLALPTRRHARVAVRTTVATSQGAVDVKGEILDLTVQGARFGVPVQLPGDAQLVVRLQRPSAPEVAVQARMIWQKPRGAGAILAVEFTNVSDALSQALRRLVTWEVTDGPKQVVRFLADFNEQIDFGGLAEQLGRNVAFDMSHVQNINSVGVSRWMGFLRSLPLGTSYSFVHCSTAFCVQAAYVLDYLGRGKILSLFAPFCCAKCGQEAERELEAAAVRAAIPVLKCSACGGELVFDGDPGRYRSCIGD